MGAYLSLPLTDKDSSDQSNERLSCGSSSMQGWRVSQEDAHNTELDFDTNTSLFAVYDGHGGAEVAKYCAMKLPQFIKDMEAYKKGEYVQALEDAFLDFDATIATPKIVQMLKSLSDKGEMEAEEEEGIDEEEEVSNLFEEATMPLEKIIAKYQEGMSNTLSKFKAETDPDKVMSPCLRSRKPGPSGEEAGCSSSSKSTEDDASVSSSSNQVTTSTNGGSENNVETSVPDSSDDLCPKPSVSEKSPEPSPTSSMKESNGEVSNSKSDEVKENVSSSSQENGEIVTPSKKGKCLVKSSISSSEVSAKSSTDPPERPATKKRAAATLYNNLLGFISMDDEDDDSDSNDETFEGKEEDSSDGDETTNGIDGDSSEEAEEEEDTSDDDGEEDEEMDTFNMMLKNEAGSDSGCTAVVALLRENNLYVANAGDSRCIVCRDGKAVDMSIDHKPEDEPELARIVNAGGKVSSDGRVNGGLNLSRAIGDLGYKQNKNLGPKEQMITALPDIKTLTIDLATDEFMVLACDGIWNSMTSQEVVDFVKPKIDKGENKLSEICEQLFDNCLSPNTAGDGTGCDNMTAVIVKFKSTCSSSKKRPSEDDSNQQAKRTKPDDGK